MKRVELEHVLRASAAITLDTSFVVIGSQAVLMEFPDAPAELLLSNELDLYPALHPERADLIEGAIGQLSMFHDIAVSKCVAGRDKDADWVRALLHHRMITLDRLVERLQQLDASAHPPARLVAWAKRRAQEALP